MASKISINLDTSKENYLVCKCKQNDDLTLEAYIYENGAELSLTNKDIIIQALKADNTYIIQNTEIVKENNKILAELDRDFSRVSGTTKIEILLVESGKQNTTFSFYLEVSASAIKGAVESSNTVTVLEALDNKIVEAGAVKEETEQLIQNGGAATTGQIAEINAQLEQKANDLTLFLNKLNSGQITKIKLIGDSTVEGVGATNHNVPTDNPIIFDNGSGTVYHEANYTSPSWANKFRSVIQSDYPTVQFVNAGIGGKSAKWGNINKQYWIDEAEDVVFVQIGTNDRWECATPSEFKTELTNFLAYIKQHSNMMIVLTANPTGNDADTSTYHFGMKEVDRVITDVCKENGYAHISQYREILKYSEATGVLLDFIILNGGSHASDYGYVLMWKILGQKIGLIDNQTNWDKGNSLVAQTIVIPSGYFTPITTTTPITNSIFKAGKLTVYETNGTDQANFPEGQTGKLTTWKGTQSDLYSTQIFEPRQSINTYKRYWIYSTGTWSAWFKINFDIYYTGAVARTVNTPLTDYPIGQVQYTDITDSTGFPEASAGILETYRGKVNDLYNYQTYTIRQGRRTYKRVWNYSTSTWGRFQRIGGDIAYTTTQRNALSQDFLNDGDMIFDTTLGKPIWRFGSVWKDSSGTTV